MPSEIITIGNKNLAGSCPAVKGPKAPPETKSIIQDTKLLVNLPIDPDPFIMAETVASALDPFSDFCVPNSAEIAEVMRA